MIRHQWAMERLCGPTLYFGVWFKINGQSSVLGNRFKRAMNDAFDDFVGISRRWKYESAVSAHMRKGHGPMALTDCLR